MIKPEVVKQQDLKDCGACCLYSIIKYYDGYVPLEKIREDTYTTVRGTTAYHLVEAAKQYGFDAMGVQVDDIDSGNLYFPMIAHVVLDNGLQHFVVVYKVSKTEVYLMDPARGRVKMKKDKFLAIWDNVLILLTPITQVVKYEQNKTISSKLFQLIIHNKSIFGKICLINIVLTVFTILYSFYFQVALSFIEEGQEFTFLKVLAIIFLWFTLMKVVLTFIKNYYLTYFYKNLDIELFSGFLNHIFNLPLKFMQNRSTGEVLSRVQELSEIKDLLSEFFTNVLLNSVLVIGSTIVLYTISSELFFILCFVILIYIVIGILFSRVLYKKVCENIDCTQDFHSILVENVEMNTSIKNLNLVPAFLKRLEDKLIFMLRSNLKTQTTLSVISFFKDFAYEIGLFVVTTFGIYFIYKSKLELLSFVTFNGVILYLFNPIQDFIDIIPKYYYLKASFNKLTEILNIKREEETTGLQEMPNGKIEFCDVSYSYNNYFDTLKHVSFTILSGEAVLILGPSGSGKSSLCNLIRFPNDVKVGTIKLAGMNSRDYDSGTIQNEILYVGQNEKLFTGTIRDNIICFRDVSEEEFLKVVKICAIDVIVDKRPNRYHTVLNASIDNLSGGERQRIILARALLKKAKILILDEALSEVNLDMELDIIKEIKDYYKGLTLIYVSHKDVRKMFSKVLEMEKINHV